ncbi:MULTISPECIES: calycin-like domain-containing protein [Bacteroides]|uniref:calycin-like domain-containing protein n=1 Tax=Bacteroides TaxID=816 RepID=UPI0005A82BB4|nr:calycin-like domain-containing protein [Bacteroides neonati]
MIKKKVILSITLLGIAVLLSNVSANTAMSLFTMTSINENIEGIYNGSLTRVYMNGEKKPVPNIGTEVTANADGTINLYIAPFKIGKMPGKISIDAKNISVDSNGSFNMTVSETVILTLPIFTPALFNAQISGTISGNRLTYSVATIDASYLLVPFTAIVEFTGKK